MGTIRTLQAAQGTVHSDSTTEASLARHTFLPGSLTPGKVYLVSGGAIVSSSNSSDTVTMGLRFGSTSATPASNTQCGASAAIDSVNADYATVVAYLHVQSATRMVSITQISGCDATGVTAVYSHTVVHTIAQTTTYYLDYTADWSVAHADNDIAAEAFAVIELA